jgi:hypothetical protein
MTEDRERFILQQYSEKVYQRKITHDPRGQYTMSTFRSFQNVTQCSMFLRTTPSPFLNIHCGLGILTHKQGGESLQFREFQTLISLTRFQQKKNCLNKYQVFVSSIYRISYFGGPYAGTGSPAEMKIYAAQSQYMVLMYWC